MEEKKTKRTFKAIEEGKITNENSMEVFQLIEDFKDEFEEKISNLETDVSDAVKLVKDSEVSLDKVLESIKGKDGYTPEKGKDYFDGEPGKNYIITDKDKKQIAESIKVPIVEKIIEKTERVVIKEQPIIKNEIKEVAVFDEKKFEAEIPKLGQPIRDALELLPEGERLKIDFIEDLRKELAEIKKLASRPAGGITGIGARDLVIDIDLSTRLDGVTKTFNLQAIWNVISVSLSSYSYGSLRKNVDYTWTPTSITFTDEIAADTQLSIGQKCVLTVVQG